MTERIARCTPCIVAITVTAAFCVALTHIADVPPAALWQGLLAVANLIAR